MHLTDYDAYAVEVVGSRVGGRRVAFALRGHTKGWEVGARILEGVDLRHEEVRVIAAPHGVVGDDLLHDHRCASTHPKPPEGALKLCRLRDRL